MGSSAFFQRQEVRHSVKLITKETSLLIVRCKKCIVNEVARFSKNTGFSVKFEIQTNIKLLFSNIWDTIKICALSKIHI